MELSNNKKGFTLVEIVIVLAIAALILAAILFAVQGAQQSRRDSARRDSGGQIGALMEEYAGNHNGTYPDANDDLDDQIAARTQSPTGTPYNLLGFNSSGVGGCPTTEANEDDVILGVGGAGNRQWQVCVGLESGDWFRANN